MDEEKERELLWLRKELDRYKEDMYRLRELAGLGPADGTLAVFIRDIVEERRSVREKITELYKLLTQIRDEMW